MRKIHQLSSLLGEKVSLLILLLCSYAICISISSLSLTMFVKVIINLLFDQNVQSNQLFLWGIMLIFSSVFMYITGYYTKKMIYGKSQYIKETLLGHLFLADLGKMSGSLDKWITHITQDVKNLLSFLDEILPDFFETIFTTLVMLMAAAYFDWTILLFSVVCSFIYGITLVFAKKMEGYEQDLQSHGENINSFLLEYKEGIPIIHIFSGAGRFVSHINREIAQVKQISLKRAKILAVLDLLAFGSNMIRELGVLLIGPLVMGLDLGTTVALINITSFINGAMASFGNTIVNFQKTSVAVNRIHEALNTPKETETEGKQFPVQKALEAEAVSFSYPSGYGINDLQMKLPARSILGICGPIGSGKSTFCKVLIGLFEQNKGSIFADTQMLEKADRRLSTAYVDQKSMIFSGTILENISSFSKEPDLVKAQNAAREAGILDWITQQEQGMDTVLEAGQLPMSGGQRQRLAIARALYKDADLLIFDEPVSALDKEGQNTFMELIHRLKQEKTICIISHQLNIFTEDDWMLEFQNGTAAFKKFVVE